MAGSSHVYQSIDARHRFPRVTASIVNYGEVPILRQCLRSIAASDYPNLDLILIDNHGPGRLIDWVAEELPRIRIIRNSTNRGYAAAQNQGIEEGIRAGSEFVWVLNNDVIVGRGTLRRLVACALERPRAAVTAPVVVEGDWCGEIETYGFMYNNVTGKMKRLTTAHFANRVVENCAVVDSQHGCAILVRTSAVRSCGNLWERLEVYFEETEFCLRARDGGFVTIVVLDARVFHAGSATMNRFLIKKAYLLLRNLVLVQFRRLPPHLFPVFMLHFLAIHLPVFVAKGVLFALNQVAAGRRKTVTPRIC